MSLPVSPDGRAELPVSLQNAIRSRLEGEVVLPLLPDTVSKVLGACKDVRADLDEIADLITHDQSLAAHILRIANSAGYAPRMPILSLQQAIGRVGLATVSDIAVAVALKERVFSVPGYQPRIRELWRHSAATACYASEISTLLHGDLESAFLCGLLLDVGMPITMQVVCDLEKEQPALRVTTAVMEAAMLEFHCAFGEKIAQAWKLGPWIGAVIRYHHEPKSAKFRPGEITIIALADALAYWALDEGKTEEDFLTDPRRMADPPLHEGALESLLRRRAHVLEAVKAFS